jgi:predicted nucleic acid-binding protein
MYLLGDRAGWRGQERLWRLALRGDLELAPLEPELWQRSRDLMEKYADLPMDLADATLVATAEARNLSRVFTLDSDFRVYRLKGKGVFETLP